MKKIVLIVVILFLAGCGNSEDGASGSEKNDTPLVTIRLVNSTTGNPIRDGTIETVLRETTITPLLVNGSCCTVPLVKKNTTIFFGITDETGEGSFSPNADAMPTKEEWVKWDFSDVNHFMNSPEECMAIPFLGDCNSAIAKMNAGYFIKAGAPGFDGGIELVEGARVSRKDLIPTETGALLEINPIPRCDFNASQLAIPDSGTLIVLYLCPL